MGLTSSFPNAPFLSTEYGEDIHEEHSNSSPPDYPSNNAHYCPSPDDVYEVRRVLLAFVPAELAIKIIEDARYWPKVSCKTSVNLERTISENNGPVLCLLTPRLSDSIPTKLAKIREVHFLIKSHDQGWCSDASFFSTQYQGSWTWFEAAIVRDFNNDQECSKEGFSSPRGIKDCIENALKSQGNDETSEITIVKNSSQDSGVWHIQRNVRAFKPYTTHEVVWSEKCLDGIDEREHITMTGAGQGEGFVRSLALGDRIAVIARARFPAWENYIGKAQINIFYSV